jgi:hypothetical protein
MINLEELERSILAGARQELGPSATDRMRIQSGLVLTEAWWKPAPLRRSVLRGVARSWRGGVAVGMVLGALLGYGVGQQLSVMRSAVPTLPASESVVAVAPAVSPAEVAPAAVISAPELDSAAMDSAAMDSAAMDSAPPTTAEAPSAALPGGSPSRASESGTLRRAVARDKGSTLAQELSLLQRARRALNRNDARLALGIVQSLDERFPNGVLMEERSATRILSLCQLERTQEARDQGHRFLAAHPRSVYAERVRDSCAGGQ